jgi:hypothetical protein
MKNILVYTIFRNSATRLEQYYSQIKNVIESHPEYNFYLSLYENDSSDNTKELLNNLDWKFVKHFSLITENIGTNFFGSVKEEQRVKNLAAARNKAIEANDFVNQVDYILDIESDMQYSTDVVSKILKFQETHSLTKVDIVSAVSRLKNNNVYDTWATRRTADEEDGNLHENWKETLFGKYYATCNGICLFDAVPFQQGARYGWYNERFNKYDCDTSVICEEFHKLNYSEIYIDHTANCYHN